MISKLEKTYCLVNNITSLIDPFFAEKIAREELHMAHAGDEIYLID